MGDSVVALNDLVSEHHLGRLCVPMSLLTMVVAGRPVLQQIITERTATGLKA
jgi:hypothetical protein